MRQGGGTGAACANWREGSEGKNSVRAAKRGACSTERKKPDAKLQRPRLARICLGVHSAHHMARGRKFREHIMRHAARGTRLAPAERGRTLHQRAAVHARQRAAHDVSGFQRANAAGRGAHTAVGSSSATPVLHVLAGPRAAASAKLASRRKAVAPRAIVTVSAC